MRRRWLVRGAAVIATVALVAVAAGFLAWSRAKTSNVGELGFHQRLRIPPLLEPTVDDAGRKVFELEAGEGTSELMAGEQTHTRRCALRVATRS